jgi:hypothetical protein
LSPITPCVPPGQWPHSRGGQEVVICQSGGWHCRSFVIVAIRAPIVQSYDSGHPSLLAWLCYDRVQNRAPQLAEKRPQVKLPENTTNNGEPNMTTRALPSTAVALGFADRINRGDLQGLGAMMTANHRLEVFDEKPVIGRAANIAAWQGYLTAFPRYVIYPHRINAADDVVAILGHTTGSHLGLPDAEEQKLLLIWLAHIKDGAVERWCLIEDTPAHRQRFGLDR